MSQELLSSLEYIEKEKGVSREVLFDAIRHALISACRKSFPEYGEDFDVQIDPATFRIQLLRDGKPFQDPHFGRIAAQTAKQVIIQKIREAQRDSIFDEFTGKQGDIVNGTVHRVEQRAIIVDFGKTEGILPAREMSPVDQYRQGNVIRAYVVEVNRTARGPEIILSRSHPEFVKKLFELEVPEIADKLVLIKGVAREAGSRSKVAVVSSDPKIDCVGSCVGVRGQRVKNIVRELEGEKIDIVPYSENIEEFIKSAMSPAEILTMKMDPARKIADLLVKDDQLSLAIGKRGQNVRLASKLVGWTIDVRSEGQRAALDQLKGVDPALIDALKAGGILSIKDVLKSSPEELAHIPGLTAETAKQILQAAEGLKAEKAQAEAEKSAEEIPAEEKAEAVKPEAEKPSHSSSEPLAQPEKD
ncbi:MAG TPA: transcription termination factor NusA [Candidatus Omnitrophota bacterium]|nr:transcription termination/antitermination protein NusA [Candidatus Omnitrophota bacterium]HRK62217.1 transcription termination factor NusA [Candidatus Omnitrophota bacterium]